MTTSTALPPKRFTNVHGLRLAHVEMGSGDPIVLLHGNPTSSYLWRDVMPPLAELGRVIAPDLIGHGDSDKLPASAGPGRYTFEGTYDLLAAHLDALGVNERVTLVLHDWGSALGFHWARLHPERVCGIAYMEAIVMPLPSWNDWPEKARGIFQGFRSAKGEDLILSRNMFIEGVLPSSILRKLSDEEMAAYRAPFTNEADRQPMLNWPRQIPIAGEPAPIVDLVQQYADWLKTSPIPKLFINAQPGSILVGAQREFCRSWPNQSEVTVRGLHFIQEDSGELIGQELAAWISTIDRNWISTTERKILKTSDVPAYVIANLHITDAVAYRRYEKGFFPLLKKYGGEFVTYDDEAVTLEGSSPRSGRMIIFKFPSEAKAHAWYADFDYQVLSEHRRAGTRAEFVTIVRGLPPR